MSKSLIYAELLNNIRQISVIAALDSPCDGSTSVELSADGQKVILHHHGHITSLKLPGQVAESSRLQKPASGNRELSWRLSLNDPSVRPSAENAVSNEAPWPATDLEEEANFSCRSCGTLVLKQGVIRSWRDLPSENWAEMMDFWHCHKPDVPGSNGNGHNEHEHDLNTSRGYGANTKFTAQPGIGFVDLNIFLVSESDCSRVKEEYPADDAAKYPKLVCSGCKNYLGHVDYQAEGYRLYKWRLKSRNTSISEPTLSSLITAQLQSIMLAQCSSRLVLLPMNWQPSSPQTSSSPVCFLSMWILSPTIRYSTTAQDATAPGKLAMKIFWKSISATEADNLLNGSSHEEVSLSTEAIIEIEKCLRDSASFLPPSGRKFQDWDVGLLERFDRK
ncbi:Ubiquitin-conjugating enzyme E2C-binding [Hyphodiscus hymeniophilus]|uniref:Ubiquitin-conjugating enzyme E2C-binding n=1 Tax=Hyphodiscus hymeniophilus TaxID=353542 RepID=A0A9P6VI80_9HELO|nr:Ubiquitin-conjugating enzyme E2C-binding [Hyphodiscus hymeniophilus]